MNDGVDFYDRLGIPQDASKEEIRKAYHNAAQKLHPDVNIEAGATELFLGIKEAYEILIDPIKRTAYDGKSKEIPPPPIRFTSLYSRNTLPWMAEEQLVYNLITMDVVSDKIEKEETSAPINVTVVMDCSTSMQGRRLEVVKASAVELVRSLRAQDIFSLVEFNDRARTVIPAVQYANNLKSISRIRMLQTKGGTEIFKGLNFGFTEIKKNLSPYYINHIILITDGHTYGDESHCIQLAEKCADQQIGISCLGIGEKWNDEFLDNLANITGGSCFYIKDPRDIQILLKQKFNNLGNILVEGINLSLNTGPGVELRYAFRLQPDANKLLIESPIRLGNIPKGHQLAIVLEFLLSPISPSIQKVLLAEGSITFTMPSQDNTQYRIPVNLSRNTSANPQQRPPNKLIIEAMSRLTLYRMQEQANKELESGEYHAASSRLKNMATHFFAHGAPDLAKTALKEAKNIQKQNQISDEGQKQIKYGTQALFLPVDIEVPNQ